jgi:hypothetical protein
MLDQHYRKKELTWRGHTKCRWAGLYRGPIRKNKRVEGPWSAALRLSVIEGELSCDAHIEVRVHAPYSTHYRRKVTAVHERASTIDLFLRNQTVRLEVGDEETGPSTGLSLSLQTDINGVGRGHAVRDSPGQCPRKLNC